MKVEIGSITHHDGQANKADVTTKVIKKNEGIEQQNIKGIIRKRVHEVRHTLV